MENVPPERLVLLASQIAIEIAKGKGVEEINLARSMATQVASALQVILSQRLINEKRFKFKKDPN